jgi:glycosyltransferase involved in cell wall biosynthesis
MTKIKIAHLIETIELGGVLRNLETLMAHMTDVEHIRYDVSPRRELPPNIPADQLVVIHFTSSWSKLPYLAALRAMRGTAPIVIVEHSYTQAYEKYATPSVARFRAMLRLTYGFVDKVVAVSHGQGAWLRRLGVVNPAKVTVVPSSTYCGPFLAIAPPERSGACAAPLRIGSLGRYHEQKGYGNLVKAMRLLPDGMATLSLAGLGPYEDNLRAMSADMPNITINGPTKDVAGFMAGLDVVAMPSRWESFGQVALEGRAAARPLISSAVDGLIEQTRPEWGWLVAEDDIEGLASAMRAASRADIAAMGNAARVSAHGHLEASMQAWRDLANDLIPHRHLDRQAA